jgi:iron complex outermembrane receptor protein
MNRWSMLLGASAFALLCAPQANAQSAAAAGQQTVPAPDATTGDAATAATSETQTATPTTPGDGEVVVTALKRSESLKDTPATIQAIEPVQIRSAQVAELANIGRLVPSMQIYTSPLGSPALFLYGMGTSAAGATFEQSVMPFFDGVANGHARSLQVGLYDLAGVEVVKGTQSILGKNASLGAVLVSTEQPKPDFSASVTARYEFSLKSPYLEGYVNVPVSDTLAVRVAGQIRHDGGWVRNTFLNRNEPELNAWSGRVSILWRPTTNFSYSLVFQHDNRRTIGTAFESVATFNNGGAGPALCALAGVTCDFTKNFQNQQDASGVFGGVRDRLVGNRVIGTGALDLNGLTLTSITGYVRYTDHNVLDVDQLPLPLLTSDYREADKQISQELRLSSDEHPFGWMVGVFYAHDRFQLPIRSVGAPVIVRNGQTLWAIDGSTDFGFDQRTDTMSVFGSANYEIADRLEISGGVRYTDETRKAVISNTRVVPGFYSNVLKPPFPATLVSRNSTTPDYNAALRFKATDDVTLYVSYGKGTKSGGFNNQPLPGATYAAFRTNAEFGEETARTIEGGIKANFPGIGYANLSVFRVKVDNFQASTTVGPLLIYLSRNQRSAGASFDAAIHPLEGLSLRGSATYVSTRDETVNLPLTYAPKWSGIVGVDYDRPVSGMKLGAGVELEFRSSQFNRQPSSTTPPPTEFVYNFGQAQRLNARIALGAEDGRYELALLGRNLTDSRIVDTAYGGTGFTGIGASYERPRTVAVQFTARY